jgi:hypothetical protein
MGHVYRWRGARPLRRNDGSVVTQGQTFEATEQEYERQVRRGSPLLELAVQTSEEEAEVEEISALAEKPAALILPQEDEVPEVEEVEEESQGPVWPINMRPELYLRLNAKGEHAVLARQLLGLPPEEPEELVLNDEDLDAALFPVGEENDDA